MPLVSVIIIFFNAERFLDEAIESVFGQTYDAWELLLVDDGSTDGSTAIAQRYTDQHPGKVRYLEHTDHQNRGMSASRNLGIGNAQGAYIAFLDADDVWLSNKLDRQVAILDAQPEAAMVYGPAQWWYSWTGRAEDRLRDYIPEPGVQANALLEGPTLLTRFLRLSDIAPCPSSVLIRRNLVEQVGGFEDRFRGLYEDQVFFAKVCLSQPVFVSSECSARYRQHPNSNCSISQETAQHATGRLAFLRWLADYLSKDGVNNGVLRKALQREIWPYRHPNLDRIYQLARRGLPGKIWRSSLRFKCSWLSLPLVRNLRCLQFRRLQPLGHGRQRGTPIVRYYWDDYVQKHHADIRGTALEIGTTYTIRRFGGVEVTRAEAIDLLLHSPEVAVVADLSRADAIPSDHYDCFVNPFTMHLIYDADAALYHAIRILKPGGTLLINFSCVDYYFPRGLDMGTGEPMFVYHSFTPIQVENMLRSLNLRPGDYTLDVYGNLFARISYQLNMAAEELTHRELDCVDPGHPLLICARVVKPAYWQARKPDYRTPWKPGITPAQWNPVTGHYAT